MGILYEYILVLVISTIINLFCFSLIVSKIHKKEVGFLFLSKLKKIPIIIFYLLYLLGLVFFVLNRAISRNSFYSYLLVGFLLVLVSYVTYDLTEITTHKSLSRYVSQLYILLGILL